jgi:hypothetical protein
VPSCAGCGKLSQCRATLSAEALREYEKLLVVPEAITRSMTEFTPDGGPIEIRRHQIDRAIESLERTSEISPRRVLHGAETRLDSEVGRLRKGRSGSPLRILGEDLSPGVSRAWQRLGHCLERIGHRGAFSNSPLIARTHELPSPQAAFFTE